NLREVEAVLDDDVEVDLDAPVTRLHGDSVGEPIAARQAREAAAGHPDDPVALRSDVPHDLRDRLGPDGDRSELGRPCDVGAPVHAARLDDTRRSWVTAWRPGRPAEAGPHGQSRLRRL